jgi:hypothetical protein
MTSVKDYFEGKPDTYEIFQAVERRLTELGPSEVSVGSQVSFGVKRKFAWFWLYNVTKKNPSGILHVMLAIDQEVDDLHIRDISLVSKNRWNHQIVIRTLEDARSGWLGRLLQMAYSYGSE